MMPCIPIKHGFVCLRNEPVEINYGGERYLFEWTAWAGWVAVNRDGSERRSPVPKAAWERIASPAVGLYCADEINQGEKPQCGIV